MSRGRAGPPGLLDYGPLTSENVHVDVYAVPLATAFDGIESVHVGLNVWLPMPVFATALKSLVAVGATVAAGSVYG
jgi:hypothetical protein